MRNDLHYLKITTIESKKNIDKQIVNINIENKFNIPYLGRPSSPHSFRIRFIGGPPRSGEKRSRL